MARFALIVIILGLVPFAIYWMRVAISGQTLRESAVPVQRLMLQSFILIIVAMIALMLFSHNGASRDGRYVPPSLVNGEVVPGYFEEDPPEDDTLEATSP